MHRLLTDLRAFDVSNHWADAVQRQEALSADDVRARRMVTRRERDDGLMVIEAVLPADEAAIVFAAIEHEAAQTRESHRRGDGNVSAGMPIVQDGSVIGCFADGTGVSAETARRLACDCGVVHLSRDATPPAASPAAPTAAFSMAIT